MSYLPLAHVFERAWVESASLVDGNTHVYFAETLETFVADLQRARPTLFLSVPRLWLKFQQGVFAKVPPKKLNRLLSRSPFVRGAVAQARCCKGLGLDSSAHRRQRLGADPGRPDRLVPQASASTSSKGLRHDRGLRLFAHLHGWARPRAGLRRRAVPGRGGSASVRRGRDPDQVARGAWSATSSGPDLDGRGVHGRRLLPHRRPRRAAAPTACSRSPGASRSCSRPPRASTSRPARSRTSSTSTRWWS
jgi:hypothetical protein